MGLFCTQIIYEDGVERECGKEIEGMHDPLCLEHMAWYDEEEFEA